MLNKIIASLISAYVDKYVEDVRNSLQFGIFNGQAQLHELKLRCNALDDFGLPLDVERGHIGQLTITIPWTRLGSQAVVLEVDRLFVLAKLRPFQVSAKEEAEQKRRAEERKRADLEVFDAQWRARMEAEELASTGQAKREQDLVTRLKDVIVRNFRVNIKSVHIRLEVAESAQPFAVGLAWSEMSLSSADAEWRPSFVTSPSDLMHKLLRLDNFSVYIDPLVSTKGYSDTQWVDFMQQAIKGSHVHVVQPLALAVRIQLLALSLLDPSRPQQDIDIALEAVELALDSEQYVALLELADFVTNFGRLARYYRHRPRNTTPRQDPRAFWRYAIACVREHVRTKIEEARGGRWRLLQKLEPEYLSLHKRHAEDLPWQTPLNAGERGRHAEIEKLLTVEEICGMRAKAYRELNQEKREHGYTPSQKKSGWLGGFFGRKNEASSSAAPPTQARDLQPQQSSGWLSGWFGRKPSAEPPTSPSPTGPPSPGAAQRSVSSDSSSIEQSDPLDYAGPGLSITDIAEAVEGELGSQPERNSGEQQLRPHSIRTIVNFSLMQSTLRLSTSRRPFAILNASQWIINCKMRTEGMLLEMALADFVVCDELNRTSKFREIAKPALRVDAPDTPSSGEQRSEHAGRPDAVPLLFVAVDTCPVDKHADTSLRVTAMEMNLVFNPTWLQTLLSFWAVPPHVNLSSLEALVVARAQSLTAATADGLRMALDSHSVLDLNIDLDAPTIIIPEDCDAEETRVLAFDLGRILITAVPDVERRSRVVTLASALANKTGISGIAADLGGDASSSPRSGLVGGIAEDDYYDTLHIAITRMGGEVATFRVGQKVSGLSVHVVEPLALDVTLANCLLPSAGTLPRFKVGAVLQRVVARLSPALSVDLARISAVVLAWSADPLGAGDKSVLAACPSQLAPAQIITVLAEEDGHDTNKQEVKRVQWQPRVMEIRTQGLLFRPPPEASAQAVFVDLRSQYLRCFPFTRLPQEFRQALPALGARDDKNSIAVVLLPHSGDPALPDQWLRLLVRLESPAEVQKLSSHISECALATAEAEQAQLNKETNNQQPGDPASAAQQTSSTRIATLVEFELPEICLSLGTSESNAGAYCFPGPEERYTPLYDLSISTLCVRVEQRLYDTVVSGTLEAVTLTDHHRFMNGQHPQYPLAMQVYSAEDKDKAPWTDSVRKERAPSPKRTAPIVLGGRGASAAAAGGIPGAPRRRSLILLPPQDEEEEDEEEEWGLRSLRRTELEAAAASKRIDDDDCEGPVEEEEEEPNSAALFFEISLVAEQSPRFDPSNGHTTSLRTIFQGLQVDVERMYLPEFVAFAWEFRRAQEVSSTAHLTRHYAAVRKAKATRASGVTAISLQTKGLGLRLLNDDAPIADLFVLDCLTTLSMSSADLNFHSELGDLQMRGVPSLCGEYGDRMIGLGDTGGKTSGGTTGKKKSEPLSVTYRQLYEPPETELPAQFAQFATVRVPTIRIVYLARFYSQLQRYFDRSFLFREIETDAVGELQGALEESQRLAAEYANYALAQATAAAASTASVACVLHFDVQVDNPTILVPYAVESQNHALVRLGLITAANTLRYFDAGAGLPTAPNLSGNSNLTLGRDSSFARSASRSLTQRATSLTEAPQGARECMTIRIDRMRVTVRDSALETQTPIVTDLTLTVVAVRGVVDPFNEYPATDVEQVAIEQLLVTLSHRQYLALMGILQTNFWDDFVMVDLEVGSDATTPTQIRQKQRPKTESGNEAPLAANNNEAQLFSAAITLGDLTLRLLDDTTLPPKPVASFSVIGFQARAQQSLGGILHAEAGIQRMVAADNRMDCPYICKEFLRYEGTGGDIQVDGDAKGDRVVSIRLGTCVLTMLPETVAALSAFFAVPTSHEAIDTDDGDVEITSDFTLCRPLYLRPGRSLVLRRSNLNTDHEEIEILANGNRIIIAPECRLMATSEARPAIIVQDGLRVRLRDCRVEVSQADIRPFVCLGEGSSFEANLADGVYISMPLHERLRRMAQNRMAPRAVSTTSTSSVIEKRMTATVTFPGSGPVVVIPLNASDPSGIAIVASLQFEARYQSEGREDRGDLTISQCAVYKASVAALGSGTCLIDFPAQIGYECVRGDDGYVQQAVGIEVGECTAKLSDVDINALLIAMSAVSRRRQQQGQATRNTSVPPPASAASVTPDTKRLEVVLQCQDWHLVLLQNQCLPMLRLNWLGFGGNVVMQGAEMKGVLQLRSSLEHYNQTVSTWEPILEECRTELRLDIIGADTSLAICGQDTASFNVTDQMLSSLLPTVQRWAASAQQTTPVALSVDAQFLGAKQFLPYVMTNKCGLDLELVSKELQGGNSSAFIAASTGDARLSVVAGGSLSFGLAREDDLTLSMRFSIPEGMPGEGLRSDVLRISLARVGQVALRITGFPEGVIPDPEVVLHIRVMSDQCQKAVDVRSRFVVSNTCDKDFDIRVVGVSASGDVSEISSLPPSPALSAITSTPPRTATSDEGISRSPKPPVSPRGAGTSVLFDCRISANSAPVAIPLTALVPGAMLAVRPTAAVHRGRQVSDQWQWQTLPLKAARVVREDPGDATAPLRCVTCLPEPDAAVRGATPLAVAIITKLVEVSTVTTLRPPLLLTNLLACACTVNVATNATMENALEYHLSRAGEVFCYLPLDTNVYATFKVGELPAPGSPAASTPSSVPPSPSLAAAALPSAPVQIHTKAGGYNENTEARVACVDWSTPGNHIFGVSVLRTVIDPDLRAQVEVRFHCPYWLLDASPWRAAPQSELLVKNDGKKPLPLASAPAPGDEGLPQGRLTMFSQDDWDPFGHGLTVAVSGSNDSKLFPIDNVGQTGLVRCHTADGRRTFNVGVAISLGPGEFQRSKVICLSHAFEVVNETRWRLVLQQADVQGTDLCTLGPGSRSVLEGWYRTPLSDADGDPPLQLQLLPRNALINSSEGNLEPEPEDEFDEYRGYWSTPFGITSEGTFDIVMRSRSEPETRFVVIRGVVHQKRAVTYVVLSDQAQPAFRVLNRTFQTVRVRQVGLPIWNTVSALQSLPLFFTTSAEGKARTPALQVSVGDSQPIEINPTALDDKGCSLAYTKDREMKVTVEIGTDSILIVVRDPRNFPRRLALDTANTVAASATTSLTLAGSVGLSLIAANPETNYVEERAYIFMESLKLTVAMDAVSQRLGICAHRLQIDSQHPNANFPVIATCMPVEVEEEQAAGAQEDSSQPRGPNGRPLRPAMQLTVVKTIPPVPTNIDQYQYLSLLMQAWEVTADDTWLFGMAAAFGKVVPTHPVSLAEFLEKETPVYRREDFIDNSRRLFFHLLQLHPFRMNLTYISDQNTTASSNPLVVFISTVGMAVANIDNAPLKFNALILDNPFGTQQELIGEIRKHYVRQGLMEAYKVLGSVQMLGNPVGLFKNIGTGVFDFFYEPAQGITHGPAAFAKGVGKGTLSLAKNSVYGISNAISGITSSAGKGLANLSGDDEYIRERRKMMRKKPKHLGEGLLEGAEALGRGLYGGITGVVMRPMEGAREGGALGFMKGAGKGVVGLVVKPVTGLVDLAAKATQGLRNTTTMFDQSNRLRVRPPRVLHDNVLLPYNDDEAAAALLLHTCKEGVFAAEDYRAAVWPRQNEEGGDKTAGVCVIFSARRIFWIESSTKQVVEEIPWTCIDSVAQCGTQLTVVAKLQDGSSTDAGTLSTRTIECPSVEQALRVAAAIAPLTRVSSTPGASTSLATSKEKMSVEEVEPPPLRRNLTKYIRSPLNPASVGRGKDSRSKQKRPPTIFREGIDPSAAKGTYRCLPKDAKSATCGAGAAASASRKPREASCCSAFWGC